MDIILPKDSKLEPVIWKKHWSAIMQSPKYQQIEIARCSREPWHWLVNWVWTKKRDDIGSENELGKTLIERFPPKEYLRFVFNKLFTEPKYAESKSRQLIQTWLFMAYYLWWAQFVEHEEIVCQAKKEDDVDTELIERADFMWLSQPIWMRPQRKRSFRRFQIVPTSSKILGIPSGADQIRSHNPTKYFLDEAGFFEGNFEECRTTALACCRDVKIISTANAGQWEDFITDSIAA